MKKNIIINPIGLKGNEINERIKELMKINTTGEKKSDVVVEITKTGPDGNAYAIIRENHEWYIKKATKKTNLVVEDFNYIGGLQNKKSEAYDSYSNAIKHLGFKFKSLAEAWGYEGEINVFKNDYLISESGVAGFSTPTGSGFSGVGNLDGNIKENDSDEEVGMTENDSDEEVGMTESEDIELTEAEEAIDAMMNSDDEKTSAPDEKTSAPDEKTSAPDENANSDNKNTTVTEHKLSNLKKKV